MINKWRKTMILYSIVDGGGLDLTGKEIALCSESRLGVVLGG